jgi:hypothetical protein
VKRRKKNRSRPLKDKKGHLKFEPSLNGNTQKKDAAPSLVITKDLVVADINNDKG